jgi:AbrB family looped-hinge helix DNA binding protein
MPSATITSKGQVTIPKKVRDQLHLKAGDTLHFQIDSQSTLRVSTEKKDFREISGKFNYKSPKKEGLTVEEMDEGVSEYLRNKYRIK